LISALKMKNYGFAKSINTSTASIDYMTIGKKQPDGSYKLTLPGWDLIQKIIEVHNVNPYWLNKGVGDIFDGPATKITTNIVDEFNVIYVPTFAQAGIGRGFTDMEHFSQFPKEYIIGLPDGIHYSIPVEGDSMYPTFSNGDRVICSNFKFNSFIRWGEPYIIVHINGNLLKRIKKGFTDDTVTIVSDNEGYEPFQMPLSEIIALYIVSTMNSKNVGKRELLKLDHNTQVKKE
jgi:repressor LexA